MIDTDYKLQKECEAIAADIVAEYPDVDDAMDRIWEWVDGHEAVIYYHRAHAICQNCDIEQGEQFCEDIGEMPQSYNDWATKLAFGEMQARVGQCIQELIDEREEELA